ncbi:hypothetical protein [Aureibacillus halotolerans]|uniref:Uncharacterized protein n=1 Tax=Aureibacillus halotolerans TaxID=1508390 RepID=A0A4R6UCY2_9BACI|nr:hypothetical protein [Aureibacillus halotolerans]TDQ42993.1 hypothetical protein EV213_101425 [Aureibacillus halotolerans]
MNDKLDAQTIDDQINQIVQRGLPKRTSFRETLSILYHHIGLRHLFRDGAEIIYSIVVTLLMLTVFGAFTIGSAMFPASLLYGWICALAPLTYIVLVTLFYVYKTKTPGFDIERVCRFTVIQLAICRMLLFSLFALLVNSAFVIVVSQASDVHEGKALLLSVASLFFFASLTLLLPGMLTSVFRVVLLSFGWMGGSIWLSQKAPTFFLTVLGSLPAYVLSLASVAALLLFLFSLKGFLITKQTKEAV